MVKTEIVDLYLRISTGLIFNLNKVTVKLINHGLCLTDWHLKLLNQLTLIIIRPYHHSDIWLPNTIKVIVGVNFLDIWKICQLFIKLKIFVEVSRKVGFVKFEKFQGIEKVVLRKFSVGKSQKIGIPHLNLGIWHVFICN